MELTEAQKKISTTQAFWEMQERKQKKMELKQKHLMTPEEVDQILSTRMYFLSECCELI